MIRREVWEEINIKVREKRTFDTVDLVKRVKIISPGNIRIKNYPLKQPTTAFNASMKVNGNVIKMFARITVGYYTYTSAVVEFDIPIDKLNVSEDKEVYDAEMTLIPDNKYDLWGVEDPRVNEIEGKLFITYVGRTINYFDEEKKTEKTLPVVAIKEGGNWKKIATFVMPDEIRSMVISDKNAFMFKGKELMLFHRLHMLNGKFYLSVCKIPEHVLNSDAFKEIIIGENVTALEPAEFEIKIGWATPPIKVGEDEYLVFIHGEGKELRTYRVFAVLMNSEGIFTAVTPFYIMEPREIYEIYGDRPFVVFPCGSDICDGKVYISYGAADSVIGIGEIDLEHLLDILDKNRIY